MTWSSLLIALGDGQLLPPWEVNWCIVAPSYQ